MDDSLQLIFTVVGLIKTLRVNGEGKRKRIVNRNLIWYLQGSNGNTDVQKRLVDTAQEGEGAGGRGWDEPRE